MIQNGYCFLYCDDASTYKYNLLDVRYNAETLYSCGQLVVFYGKVYVYTELTSKIKDSENYKEIFLGFYEPIMEKFRKVETMKELKAGQWVKCVWNTSLGDHIKFEKNKWYKIVEINQNRLFNTVVKVLLPKNNEVGFFNIDNLKIYFDLNNPLDYNPHEVKDWDTIMPMSYYKKGDLFRISGMENIGMEDGIYKIEDIHHSNSEISIKWERLGVFKVETMQKEKKYTDAEVLAILIEELENKPELIDHEDIHISLYVSHARINDLRIFYKEPQSINRILALVDEAMGVQKQEEKTTFKVGDRVRILSDAIDTVNKVTVVKSHNVKSAIGCIGIIVEGRTNTSKLRVAELPNECYSDYFCSWYYRDDQLELIEEEHEPITPENIEEVLKYNGVQNWQVCKYVNGVENDILLILFDNPKWLQHLELEVGKLKPLPKKKEPTLEEALVELGFTCVADSTLGRYYRRNKVMIQSTGLLQIWFFNNHNDSLQLISYTTKEQLAKDIAAFEERYNDDYIIDRQKIQNAIKLLNEILNDK